MAYYEGLSCPVCQKAFLPNEDIVVCPQCGLPHHRACWKSIGECYATAKHGTEEQWSRDTAPQQSASTNTQTNNICPKCQKNNAEYAEFCSRCGTPLATGDWYSAPTQTPPPAWNYYAPQYTYGNTYSNESIDGIEAEDLAAIVGNNQQYYMPRFRRMADGKSDGWNWAAFLFPQYWLFYRKQYLLGSIYLFVALLFSVVYSIIAAPLQAAETNAAMMTAMQDMQNHVLFYPWMALSLINLTLSVLLGIKGNQFYYNHCRNRIHTIREKTPDLSAAELRTYGGTSVGAVIIGYVIAQFFTMLISFFLFSSNLI